VALLISPDRLQKVRNERMKEYGRASANYSTLATCSTEVSWLRSFHARKGRRWPMVDTTNGGIEENANKILKALRHT